MDFDNLFAVECSIKYDQNKLQSILKSFEQRMNHMDRNINSIDRRCQHLELTDCTTDKKFGKFESFTIENLRSTVDQFSSLNSSVSKYFGKDPHEYEKEDETIIPIDPKKQFEDKVVKYSKQADEIANEKVIKTQLSFLETFLNKQPSKIQSIIGQKQTQFGLMAEQVKKLINQKFQECKQEYTKQRKVTFNNGIQNISHKNVGGHRTSVVDKLLQMQNEKQSYKAQNWGELRPSMLDLLEGEGLPEMSHRNFGKMQSNMQFQDVKNDEDMMSNKKKNYNCSPSLQGKELKEEISKIKQTLNKGFYENSLQKNQNESASKAFDTIKQADSLSAQAVEALTSKLKNQMREIVKQQIRLLSQNFSEMTSKQELSEMNMNFMMKEFKHHKDDLEKLFNKSAELDDKIQHIRSLMTQNDDKHLNLAGRIREHELKINQLEICSMNGQSNFTESDSGQENSGDGRKFREVSNFKKSSQYDPISASLNSSSNVRISTVKNSSSSPYFFTGGEGPIVNKLNFLSEKVCKIQEKLKNLSLSSYPSEKNLPKIDSVASSARSIQGPLIEQLRKDLLKTNEQLSKMNEKVHTVKKSLQQLEAAHNQVPKKIQKIQMDLHDIKQIQEDRLIDLIKDIINRVLTDPFNNNFTNVLKRQINAKFLEIKHEYASIMKDIESRVMDRADVGELQKLKDFVQTNAIQLRTLMHKKADNEDFKKGVKYLDTKLKELYTYVKDMEEQETSNSRPQTQSTNYTRMGFLRSRKQ